MLCFNRLQTQLLANCLIKKIDVGYDDYTTRVAVSKNDTSYITEPILDLTKITRHGIFLYHKNRLPDQIHNGLINKYCRHLGVQNQYLKSTSLLYNCRDIKQQIAKPVIKPNIVRETRNLLLPQCVIQKVSVEDNDSQIKVALYKNDTFYVVERRTWDPSKISRQEIFEITLKMSKPEYVQPEVYDKDCKPIKYIKNKDLVYTSKIYNWPELGTLIKTLKNTTMNLPK